MNLELKHEVEKLKLEIESAIGNRTGNTASRTEFALEVERSLASFVTACYSLILKSDIFEYLNFVKSIDVNKLFNADNHNYRKNISLKNKKYFKITHSEILKQVSYLDRGLCSNKEIQSDIENRILKVLTELNILVKKNKLNLRGTNNSATYHVCKKLALSYIKFFKKLPSTKKFKGRPSPFDKVCLKVSNFLFSYMTITYSYTPAKNSLLIGNSTKQLVIKELRE